MGDQLRKEAEVIREALLSLATEGWRFAKIFLRAVKQLDAGEQLRYVSQYRYFQKRTEDLLSDVGYKLVNLENQRFDPGIPATPLNLEDFLQEDLLVIDQMIEPIIMGDEGLVKMGTVMLRKIER